MKASENDHSSNERSRIDELVSKFREMDVRDRLETLLEYSDVLPDLPERFRANREAGENRVHECRTPVYLWIDVVDDKLEIYADVPRDSPTVRGFISLLVDALFGAEPAEVLALNPTFLRELGIAEALGMIRMQGLQGVLHRIKSEVRRAVGETG